MQFSRWLAVVGGILAPALETIRRWSTWKQSPANLFDDYILGALLLYGAWRVSKDIRSGQRFLVAAWGFACGLGYYSFFGQLKDLQQGQPDPAAIGSGLGAGNQRHCLGFGNCCLGTEFKASTTTLTL